MPCLASYQFLLIKESKDPSWQHENIDIIGMNRWNWPKKLQQERLRKTATAMVKLFFLASYPGRYSAFIVVFMYCYNTIRLLHSRKWTKLGKG